MFDQLCCWHGIMGYNRPHLITNFNKAQEPLFREAIKQSGKDFLYIREDAYWCDGTKDESMMALWSKRYEDLSDFWRLFEKLEEGLIRA